MRKPPEPLIVKHDSPGTVRQRSIPSATWRQVIACACLLLHLVGFGVDTAHASAEFAGSGEVHLHAPGDEDRGCRIGPDHTFCQVCRLLGAGELAAVEAGLAPPATVRIISAPHGSALRDSLQRAGRIQARAPPFRTQE